MKWSELLTVADTDVLTEAAGKAVNDSTSTATYCLQGGVWLLCHMKYGICTSKRMHRFVIFLHRNLIRQRDTLLRFASELYSKCGVWYCSAFCQTHRNSEKCAIFSREKCQCVAHTDG